ncbi:CRISPR-associated endonuclease Cas6 [Halonatronum saccharophilum]|uniref:CRISPR-associated endonuclease Cas6 n=1 Tax=Halonatronum saccharophilum TaxID=150060 RepID=UPI0004AFF855|nr:CRISPR-associated endonuclease Cas6 [Halonatronum saccharophilum]
MKVKKAILKFNLEEELSLNYGHKLRGFFANKFEDLLFHHHKEDGSYRYAYPLIQYKIIKGMPTVIGLSEGAELVIKNFLDIDKLILEDKEYIQPEGRLEVLEEDLEVVEDLDMLKFKYKFYSPWMGLNQKNHKKYLREIKGSDQQKKRGFFKRILIGNILTFAKGVDWWVDGDIKVVPKLDSITINFKNKEMVGFVGEFYSNVSLPDNIGLGKATARGFGTIIKEELI